MENIVKASIHLVHPIHALIQVHVSLHYLEFPVVVVLVVHMGCIVKILYKFVHLAHVLMVYVHNNQLIHTTVLAILVCLNRNSFRSLLIV
jgi:hypothetical protein